MKGRGPPPKYGVVPAEDDVDPLRSPNTTIGIPGGVPVGGGLRKKAAAGVRPWLLLDSTGQPQVVEVGKHAIMRRTGLPGRDLRILDPLLSYPSSVLGREQAIVINLEHIKAIITAQEVLLHNSRDPSVTPLSEELQSRILSHHQAKYKEAGASGDNVEWSNLYDLEEPRSKTVSPSKYYSGSFPNSNKDEEAKADGRQQTAEN